MLEGPAEGWPAAAYDQLWEHHPDNREQSCGGREGQNHSPWAVEASLQDSIPRAVVLNTHSQQSSHVEEVKGSLFFRLLQPSRKALELGRASLGFSLLR